MNLVNWSKKLRKTNIVDSELYKKYKVKADLCEIDGKDILARLTYKGRDINDLVNSFRFDSRYRYEEAAYLILMGEQPNKNELEEFVYIIGEFRVLSYEFIRDMIMGLPCKDLINVLSRSVLGLYSYDDLADDTSIENVLRQSLQLIAVFPLLAVYAYQAFQYQKGKTSLVIHTPSRELSTAENILYMLRYDKNYSKLEASILDLLLVLYAEYGGRDNSTLTTCVVTFSDTDMYSAISAALGSLKGSGHGENNIKVSDMFEDIKRSITDWKNKSQVSKYLEDILDRKAFDNKGRIYGMGHTLYTRTDSRYIILKNYVKKLAEEKGLQDEFELYELVEKLTPGLMRQKRNINKDISANVDFYSGFVYHMLGVPEELFKSLFAVSRVVVWLGYRLKYIVNNGKIINSLHGSVKLKREYINMKKRM
ncbi:citrate synthase [Wukongibacter sp. M2B1]|uniref:citrate synthase n=1 Tax=Wukongibacter sp. M2B1 TaxID=3088895 RepID=UPI003D79FDFD